jgi:DNA polymerase III delta prime subunit
LTLVSDSLIQEESAISKRRQSHPEWDPDWVHGYFSCLLRCQKPDCDLVRMTGDTGLYLKRSEDGYIEFYTPKFFIPHLPLIESYALCPSPVQERVDAAAKIIWIDPSSAANRLRSAVEALMDDQGIPRKRVRDGRAHDVSLHSRIDSFKVARPAHTAVADLILAVKWIGNVGSHDHRLRISDVLDGVEILDHTLDQIYDSSKDEIRRKAADIAARKGVPASRISGPVPF